METVKLELDSLRFSSHFLLRSLFDRGRQEFVEDGCDDAREEERADESADEDPGERRVQRRVFEHEWDESADRGEGGEDDRREACLAGFVDRFVEATTFAAEEVGVVDEQDGVLDFDAGQASAMRPTTATNEGVARASRATTAPMMPSGMTERTMRCALEVLNSSSRMPRKPKMVITMMVPGPPKLSLLSTSPAAMWENFSGG